MRALAYCSLCMSVNDSNYTCIGPSGLISAQPELLFMDLDQTLISKSGSRQMILISPCEAAACVYHSPQLAAGEAHCQQRLADHLNIRCEMLIIVSAG